MAKEELDEHLTTLMLYMKNDFGIKEDRPKIQEVICKKMRKKFAEVMIYYIKKTSTYIMNIMLDPELKKSKPEVIIGCFAHELAHMQQTYEMIYERSINEIREERELYKKSRTYREAVERDADLKAIIAGYGEELLSCKMFRVSRRSKNNGLRPNEVKKLIKMNMDRDLTNLATEMKPN